MTTIRAAFYARVSSEQQAAAHTIESQIFALSERARSDGTQVPPERQFVDDGVSGATLARPALDRLRDLEHFSCYCIAYPQWANQAEALLPVTWAKASVMAASRLSTVRALAERSCCLIFDHACSMGLKSGE